MSEETKTCAICKVPASRRCAGCRSVVYCGPEHQKIHWKDHSKRCRSYKLVENEKLGRHYVALRRIEAGEVVIREEKSLLEAPQQETIPLCLGCYASLSQETARSCNECGWPLCGSCTRHGPECEFTKRYRDSKVSITGFGLTHPTYKCIGVVRGLSLREVDPEAYQRLSNLASSCTDDDEPQGIARFVKRFFPKLNDVNDAEIMKIAGVIQINGHEVPTTEPAHVSVYDLSSYIEHSCRANCSKSFTNSGGIVIRAATNIEKGDHISICYTDPLWGTTNRRHHLLRTKYFECSCSRCSDPTEFGTMFNAVKCTNGNCAGYMLPKTFLSSEIPAYKCTKCANTMDSDLVDELLERVGQELSSMVKNDVTACRAFLRRYAPKLHDNHFYMTDVRLALAQMLGQQNNIGLPSLSDELIAEKILLCKKLDAILTSVVPAENRVRGLVLFEMHAAIAEFARRQDRNQLFNTLQESKKLLKDAYELLKYEPDILPEGRIAKMARANLKNMEVIIQKLCSKAVAPL